MNSIEEKAKAYDEALERAKKWYNAPNVDKIPTFGNIVIDEIFPELKESEDERIRKAIGYAIGQSTHSDGTLINGVSSEEALAWLEKQANHANFCNKIQIGDKVTRNEDGVLVNLSQLKRVAKKDENQYQTFIKKDGDDAYFRGICDAKHELENQGEQKPAIEMKTPEESLGIYSNTYNRIVDECIYGEQKPAEKVKPKFKIGDNIEPIDTCLGSPRTIYKICDGWYETNQGTLDFEFENNWRLIEQKPAWSEEDEVKINRIVACLENLNVADNDILLKDVDWLKSLRSQNRWKPSDEQLYWLKWTVNRMPDTEKANEAEAVLEDLLEQLKKLK